MKLFEELFLVERVSSKVFESKILTGLVREGKKPAVEILEKGEKGLRFENKVKPLSVFKFESENDFEKYAEELLDFIPVENHVNVNNILRAKDFEKAFDLLGRKGIQPYKVLLSKDVELEEVMERTNLKTFSVKIGLNGSLPKNVLGIVFPESRFLGCLLIDYSKKRASMILVNPDFLVLFKKT